MHVFLRKPDMTSWFSRLHRQARRDHPAQLIGCWELVRADASDADIGVEIEFKADGQMQYSIPMPDTWQIIKLTWWAEANSIVTDQPSAPRVERTEFSFDGDTLVLKRPESGRSWFRSSPKRAPDV
jgi:hypothetical protein